MKPRQLGLDLLPLVFAVLACDAPAKPSQAAAEPGAPTTPEPATHRVDPDATKAQRPELVPVPASEAPATASPASTVTASEDHGNADGPPEDVAAETTDATERVEIPPAPILETGLPAVSRGKAIRLSSLEVGERKVGTKEIPSVALTDSASKDALDGLLEKSAKGMRGCKVKLAQETFVSMRCVDKHQPFPDVDQYDHATYHFVVGADGEVEEVKVWSLFHPGVAEHVMRQRMLHNPDAADRRVVVTERGIELTYPFDGGDEVFTDRLPWRLVAPYVRADSALGKVLADAGLTLAPVGTKMPSAPEAPAIWGESEVELLTRWMAAAPAARAHARLATPGGRSPVGLVFAPGTPLIALPSASSRSGKRGKGYYTPLIAPVKLARVVAPTELRDKPGRREKVTETLPEHTEVATVDGLVHRKDSAPATRQWAFVVTLDGRSGWVRGNDLEFVERVASP